MAWHAMSCHAEQWHAMPCQARPSHAMPCRAEPWHGSARLGSARHGERGMPCHAMPCQAERGHTRPGHAARRHGPAQHGSARRHGLARQVTPVHVSVAHVSMRQVPRAACLVGVQRNEHATWRPAERGFLFLKYRSVSQLARRRTPTVRAASNVEGREETASSMIWPRHCSRPGLFVRWRAPSCV